MRTGVSTGMTNETLSTTRTIETDAEAVFGILVDPSTHATIDGTGWVRESLDDIRLTETGQIFRVVVGHDKPSDGRFETANRVEVFAAPNAIAWRPGEMQEDGSFVCGGWIWRYDLVPSESSATKVTLSYDWSEVSEEIREKIGFPPFRPEPPFGLQHLENSLRNLADLAAQRGL